VVFKTAGFIGFHTVTDTTTSRKRAASGFQSGRGFGLPDAKEQVHEKTYRELVTWLVIRDGKTD
jgi:hypothetical protein